jgi:hypothetical protein
MASGGPGRRAAGPALGLRDFIHRSRVLALYRSFMRELVGLDPAAGAEMRARVREGFVKHAAETNKAAQKALLADGARELQFVRTYVGTARRARAAAGVQSDEASWVGTGESYDIRGRIGADWPWGGDVGASQSAGAGSVVPQRRGGGSDSSSSGGKPLR